MGKRDFGRKTGLCICNNCGKEFEKPLSEIRRNIKLVRNNFCSRSCVGVHNTKNLNNTEAYDIRSCAGNKRDELTPFRYHYRNIKKREFSRGIEVTITLEDLKEQWENQKGICPYIGIKLDVSEYKKINTNQITSASVDRTDSSKGYTKKNIRWVSRAINHMKNDMTDDKVLELCKLIAENYNKNLKEINP